MTYREIVYACMDLLKFSSDDSYYTEDHIIFIASKMRNMILKQRYSDIKKQIPESNYQTICMDLQVTDAIDGVPCTGQYLKSIQEIPITMKPFVHHQIYLSSQLSSNINVEDLKT